MKALLLFFSVILLFSCNQKPSYRSAPFDGQKVSIDVGLLREAVPEFYSVVLEGKKINFFVLLENGEVASYLDACKECYFKKLGYRHDNGAMVCRACNVRFPLEKLDTGIGGCYPIRLHGSRVGDAYIVDRDALRPGIKYF